jgi:hypothetical protein
VNFLSRFLLNRKIAAWRRESPDLPDAFTWRNDPQTIRLARKGHIGQGDLFIGRIEDATQFFGGLVLHFGHGDVPANIEATNNVVVHRLEMNDGSNPVDIWLKWMPLVKLGIESVRLGIKVLATCDAGCSRSTTAASAIVAYLDDLAMDYWNLARALRNKHWDDSGVEALPHRQLWEEAAVTLNVLRLRR